MVVATLLASVAVSVAVHPIHSPFYWAGITATALVLTGRYRWPVPAWLADRLGAGAAPALTLGIVTALLAGSVVTSGRVDGYEAAVAIALFALSRTATSDVADRALVAINIGATALILLTGRAPDVSLGGSTFQPDLRILGCAAIMLTTLIAVASGTPPVDAGATEPERTHAQRRGPVRRFFHRRPRMLDLLVVFWFQTGMVTSAPIATISNAPNTTRGEWLWSTGEWLWWLTMITSLVLFLRRKSPRAAFAVALAATVAATALTGTTAGIDLAVAITLYTLTTTSSPLIAWIALIAANLFTLAGLWLWGIASFSGAIGQADIDDLGIDMRIGTGIGMAIVTLAAIAIGTTVRNRREHLQRLVDRTNQLALEREQGDQLAVAAERARIAREMHDVVAHSVQVMIALSDGARALLTSQPDRASHALDELSGVGRGALDDMRRVLGVLREDGTLAELEPQPEAFDLDQLVERFRSAGLPLAYTVAGRALPSDTGLHLTLYRITQEALTNVLRYAPHTPDIAVTLRHEGTCVDLVVVNAPDPSASNVPPSATHRGIGAGRGLIGMRERVAAYNGTVSAGPYRGGWRVHATLDVAPKEDYADHRSTR